MLNPETLSALVPAVGVAAVAGVLLAPELRAQQRTSSTLRAIRRAQAHGLADLLPYRRLVRRDVAALAGGAYLAAWEFGARDTATLDEAAVVNTAYQVALTLGSLEPGTVAQFYARRSPFVEYDAGRGERAPALATLDDLRAEFFTAREPVFATRRFFVLTRCRRRGLRSGAARARRSPSAPNER